MAGGKKRKPKIIKDKKLRGEWAEMQFMARAAEYGLTATKPWGESRSYDFIVGRPGHFVTVQVKSTANASEGGYCCHVGSGSGSYAPEAFDFAAVYVVPDDVWYIIPETKIRGMRSISVYPRSDDAKYEQYREAWDLLRDAVGVKEDDQREDDGLPASGKTGETRGTPAPETTHPANTAQGGAASFVSPASAPGIVERRMANAFSFFRRRLDHQGSEE